MRWVRHCKRQSRKYKTLTATTSASSAATSTASSSATVATASSAAAAVAGHLLELRRNLRLRLSQDADKLTGY